jgi:hypothetical protein
MKMMNELEKMLDEVNGTDCVFHGKDGSILHGSMEVPGSQFGLRHNVILRFNNDGMLDGGKMPAVEYPGWVEYWVNNKRHRENGFAVSKNGFKVNERWENGKQIPS